MAQTQYLKRLPSGVYVVRMYVPRQLQPVLGKKELHASTRCRDLPIAKVVASGLVADWHRRLAGLLSMDPSKVLSGSLDLQHDGLISLDQAAAQLGSDRQRLAEHLLQRGAPFFVHLVDQPGYLIQDFDLLHHERDETGLVAVDLSDAELERHGVPRRLSSDVALRFPDEVRSLVQAGTLNACMFLLPPIKQMGFVVPIPGIPLAAEQLQVRTRDVEALRLSLLPFATSQVLQLVQQQAVPAAPQRVISSYCDPAHAETPLAELLRRHIEIGRSSWRPDTLVTKQHVAALLLDLAGDIKLGQLDRAALWEVAHKAAKLPARRNLVRNADGSPISSPQELVRIADEQQLKRISAKALADLIRDIGQFLHWGVTQGMLTRNPAIGLGDEVFKFAGGKKTRKKEARDLFTDRQLTDIFSAEWFKNGHGRRTREGKFYHYRPHYYWLPLLALYTGGRINELAQLYLADVIEESEIGAYVDFNLEGPDKLNTDENDEPADGSASQDKSLKNVNAVRQLPLHPELLRLGLLDYVKALAATGHQRLFPELAFDAKRGYGKAATKWFNDRFLGRELEIPRDGRRTFHSLRHHFCTAVGRVGTPQRIQQELMGHSRGKSESDVRYDKGSSLKQLAAPISKISYPLPVIAPFNIEIGLVAVADALKHKVSRRPGAKRSA